MGSIAALGLVGCAGEEDIDRTQPNRLPKAMFDGTWYMRSTVIGVPATSAAAFVGETGDLEKVRWEIQENYLVAYRAYEEIPGIDSAKKASSTDPKGNAYRENPVAVFRIQSHFDVKRDYNPMTGEQTNVIVENSTDRPWHERQYMRVDWAESQVDRRQFSNVAGDTIGAGAVFYVQQHEGSPDAMRILDREGQRVSLDRLSTIGGTLPEVAYFDLVGRHVLEPDKVTVPTEGGGSRKANLCIFIRYDSANYQTTTCGPTEIKVRTAFMKVKPSTYEPLPLPNTDMGKFGFFRTERYTYDRKYGFTESGRLYLANRHNIWETAYELDPSGAPVLKDGKLVPLPMKQRVPKPVTYHLSPGFPCEMVGAAQAVAGSWNGAFRRAVAVAKGLLTRSSGETDKDLAKVPKSGASPADHVPDMFRLDLNGWVQKRPGDDFSCANLERDTAREVARLGDLRFSFLAWIADRQITGPLGFGPSSADPETGEIVAGMAHLYGAALDEKATRALEIVRMLNGDLTPDVAVSADDVRSYIEKNQVQIDPTRIPKEAAALKGAEVQKLFVTPKVAAKLDTIRTQGFEKAIPGAEQRRFEALKGTGLEQALVDEEVISGAASTLLAGLPVAARDKLPKEALEALSPLKWASPEAHALEHLRRETASKHCIWLAEFSDDSVAGLALEVWKRWGKEKNYEAMWQYLREQLFRGVAEHEVGHTLGLRHNFAGSYDSLNYFNRWWQLREKPDAAGHGGLIERNALSTDGQLTFGQLQSQSIQTEAQKAGRMREYQYSSIMDYHAKFNGKIQGVGKYDEAAILFGYAGQVEVFAAPPSDAKLVLRQRSTSCDPRFESIPNPAYAAPLEQWHYSSLWNVLGKTRGVVERRFTPWATLKQKQQGATEACKKYVAAGKGAAKDFTQLSEPERELEVPYMFCSDEYVDATVSCHRWDEGADPREIVQSVSSGYKNYYYFNNYKRDRFGFDPLIAYRTMKDRYFSYLPNIYQHWLFRVASFGLDDTTLENYWTMGTWQGFNLLLDVVSRPQYGTYCRAGADGKCNASGASWKMVSEETAPTKQEGHVVVPRGEGRRRFSRFDHRSGYYFQYQTLEMGHFWEYLAALQTLTTSTGTFVGVEVSSDFNRYVIPYYIVFEDQLTKHFEGVVTDNYEAYGPRVVNGKLQMLPAATLRLNNGKELDPATGQEIAVEARQNGQTVNLDNWFSAKIWALREGMSEFRSRYSLRFADRQMIFRVGTGEEVKAGEGHVQASCTDPVGGQIYGTLQDPSAPEAEQGTAVQLIARCRREAEAYLTAKQGGNATATMRARSALNETIEWLNFLRSFYKVYGQNMD
ncbi:MAG: zinc-dependent metalloprotease [Deltaproteobacteria bacterium]|nr:zinc-dependent metalloprotease [Deltaproteobacteria bacterium]